MPLLALKDKHLQALTYQGPQCSSDGIHGLQNAYFLLGILFVNLASLEGAQSSFT